LCIGVLEDELLELLLEGKHPHPRIPVIHASPRGQSPVQKKGTPPHGLLEELLLDEADEVDEVLEGIDDEIEEELLNTQSLSSSHPLSPGPGKRVHWSPKQSKCVRIHCASLLQRSDPGPRTRTHC
jgi:hypothetical protein